MRMSTVVKEYVKEKIAEKYPLVERPKPFNTEIIFEEIKKATADIVKAIYAKYADKVGLRVYKGNGVYEIAELVMEPCRRILPDALKYPLDLSPIAAMLLIDVVYNVLVRLVYIIL